MPRVFVGNFDFEHEISSQKAGSHRNAAQIAQGFVSAWVTLAETDDIIWSPGSRPDFDFDAWTRFSGQCPRFVTSEQDLPQGAEWRLVPWGWTDAVLKLGRSRGWTCPAPSLDVVREANRRSFRWKLESDLQVALPHSAILTSVPELTRHIARFASEFSQSDSVPWVLKADFGMSGRERQLGRGATMTEPVLNWARKRMEAQGSLAFEPWLERISEVGIQLEIPPSGTPIILGVLPLITDRAGVYRGSRVLATEAELSVWDAALPVATSVGRHLQSLGYHGPCGIDAMRYRNADGNIGIRPLQDLNVRFTMGRLALELRRFLTPDCNLGHPPERVLDWLHDPTLVQAAVQSRPETKTVAVTEKSWLVFPSVEKN